MLRPAIRFQLTNKHRISGCMLALSAGMAAMLTGAAAVAADTSTESTSIEEIVVTANKLNSQKVLDLPISIQAISGDSLQRAGSSAFMDIAGQIPGLSVQDLGPGDKKYVIRGINSTGDSTVGIYYGEAVISGSNADDGGGFQSDIRLYDLDRIEVLARSARHSVRCEFHERHDPLRPQVARSEQSRRLSDDGRLRRPLTPAAITTSTARSICPSSTACWLCAWWDGKSTIAAFINQIRVGQGVTALVQCGNGGATELPTGSRRRRGFHQRRQR